MCTQNFEGLENVNEYFDLEKEMASLLGEEKTTKELLKIKDYFKNVLPIFPESIAFSGNGRFNKQGEFLTSFDHKDEFYNYLITFRKKTIRSGLEIDQTFFYAFN